MIGRRVEIARARLGLPQEVLAKRHGRSAIWLRRVEAGSLKAPGWFLDSLAELIGESREWFYEGSLTVPERLKLVELEIRSIRGQLEQGSRPNRPT